MEIEDFANSLIGNDARIEPAIIGAVANALVPKWGLKSELAIAPDASGSGLRVPVLSLIRPIGPFCDEHEYNQILSDAARFLGNGDLSRYMDTARGALAMVPSDTEGELDISVVVSRLTPPLGMYSTSLFGEIMLVELGLVREECVKPQPVNIAMAHILLGQQD